MKKSKLKNSDIVQKLLFDYESISKDQIIQLCKILPNKILRWLGANHPDNRTRKIFFRLTNVQIGKGSILNNNIVILDNYKSLLIIGERVAIGPHVNIICASHPNNSELMEFDYVANKLACEQKIVIHDDAWIGANVTILPGVVIGKKAIVGAGAIVSKNVPENSIVKSEQKLVIRKIKEKN